MTRDFVSSAARRCPVLDINFRISQAARAKSAIHLCGMYNYMQFIILQGSPEVNQSVLIGSDLVQPYFAISPDIGVPSYTSFPPCQNIKAC